MFHSRSGGSTNAADAVLIIPNKKNPPSEESGFIVDFDNFLAALGG